MAKRFMMRVEVTESAKQKLATVSDAHGMTQIAALSRVMEWFADQSALVQTMILGKHPKDIESEVAKFILDQIAGEQ